MEGEDSNQVTLGGPFPIIFIPRVCTELETNCGMSENVFIHVKITSPDTEGNETWIYNGLCNVKVVEGNDINIKYGSPNSLSINDNIPVILAEANQITFPTYNDSQVWIDPARSPYVYNHCEPPIESYTITEQPENQITIEQHNTYITQNMYNCNEMIQYSPISEEQKSLNKMSQVTANSENYTLYEEDEFECGVFLSQLSGEIIQENETRACDEQKFVGLKSDNDALKQLMSTDIQSVSRQQKTILFLGHNSEAGQTIQNISINDPLLECAEPDNVYTEIDLDDTDPSTSNPRSKKYQCNKCKHIFHQLSAFKQHMVGSHRYYDSYDVPNSVRYMCTQCGKNLKTQKKFELHCRGHGDPELECNKCHKVFASKFTLRNHLKIHSRMYPCSYCPKSYSTARERNSHATKAHNVYKCESCDFHCDNLRVLHAHEKEHKSEIETAVATVNDLDFPEGLFADMDVPDFKQDVKYEDELHDADSVIAKVMSNKLFLSHGKKRKQRRYDKTCDVCLKKFERISDLKRHLIEHVIRSTLAKNPVNNFGVLNIRCEICQVKTFTKVDRYKAHLREHAKLTLYKCTFCDKSFSDSSNFSKHKKIHGTTFFQCDICQRKFNSKKMITQHMEYHNKNRPLECAYCDKVFHFESMLNKHIKSSHDRESISKVRCKFCRMYFKSLKEKWDHEWNVHNVRKAIVDCLLCGRRFRKYAELKRHCTDEHDYNIPPAKRLMKWKLKNKLQMMESQTAGSLTP